MKKALLSIIIILATYLTSAQQFGGNPPSLKWNQINTDPVRVIFPRGLDSQAQRVASIVQYLAKEKPIALGNQLRKVNIVLQNQTTIANGYVGLGPFRSEFFLTPFPDNFSLGSLSWTESLAVHEYRHVQQFNNFRNGLSKTLSILFGEDGLSLAINAAIPDWFYEGDAVFNETVLTRQGRGRLPLFLNAYPSVWQAGKKYSWMKLRNGSLKDYVPGHYNLGWLLVNYGYDKYGTDFWGNVTRDASSYKGLVYPFQKAIKKYAGVDYQHFRRNAFDFYRSLDESNSLGKIPSDKNVLPLNTRYVANYYFPYHIGSDSLVYLKTSYRQRPAFYIKDRNGESKLRVRDISIDEQFSYRNGQIVYAAYTTDPRWGWRDYSEIRILDIRSGQQRTLTHRSRYFTPDISPDGTKVAAVQNTSDGKSEIHLLDAQTGKVLNTIKAGEISLYTDPKFIDDNTLVTAVRLTDGKMSLAKVDAVLGSTARLTPPSYNVVGYPSVSDSMIFFTASYGGNDDIFALRLADQKIFRVTRGPKGNYFVNAPGHGGKITWSTFTADGYQLQQMDEKDMDWAEVDPATIDSLIPALPVSKAGGFNDILISEIGHGNYPVTSYRKSTKLFNFHSWRPYYSDPEFRFSIYGQNILNTLETETYYLYNDNEDTHALGFDAAYGAWFPFLHLGSVYTFNRKNLAGTRSWNQLDAYVGLSVPLLITSGRSFKNFNVGTNFVYRTDHFKHNATDTSLSYLHHYFSLSQQVQRATQHIFPRSGYALSVNHRHAVTRNDAYQFIARATLYLPGVMNHHHFIITGSFQQRDTVRAFFSSGFANARGYADYYRTTAGSRMWRLSANYHLPLVLPDWGFGNILYIQRVRTNLFYDFQQLFSNNKNSTADLRSAGIELYADTKWWNQYPLTFGLRYSRLLDNDPRGGNAKGSNLFEFIVPVSIIPR